MVHGFQQIDPLPHVFSMGNWLISTALECQRADVGIPKEAASMAMGCALLYGARCLCCFCRLAMPVSPAFMRERASALDRRNAETAAQIVEGHPSGVRHRTVADAVMIADAHDPASCQVRIRINRLLSS